jgi:hypothetical protein
MHGKASFMPRQQEDILQASENNNNPNKTNNTPRKDTKSARNENQPTLNTKQDECAAGGI